MKKYIPILALILAPPLLAQEQQTSVETTKKQTSVEKSVFNIQTGFVGVWLNNELGLNRKIALRTEVGLEPMWSVNEGTVWHPNLRLEPRYYYNLDKRVAKNYSTANNSGNFFGVAFNYRPEAVVFSTNKGLKAIESFSVVPKWGIRRLFAKYFNYEAGFGFGFRHEFKYGNYGEFDIHLRVGYSF